MSPVTGRPREFIAKRPFAGEGSTMADKPWDAHGDARRALEAIVRDQHYGATALSQPAVVSNLLKDLLPDEPREASLLVAAAQADLAGTLRGYVDQGLDLRTATSLTARAFADTTSHTQEACSWVVGELAAVLGLNRPAMAGAEPVTALHARQPADTTRLEPTSPETARQQPVAPGAAAGQVPAGPDRMAALRAALVASAAAYFLLLACIAPYVRLPGEASMSILTGVPDEPVSEIFWLAIDPAAVVLAAIGTVIVLLVPKRLPWPGRLLPGMLLAFGIQAILLFAGLSFAAPPPARHEVGGFIGLLGAAALLATGIMTSTRGRPFPADATAPAVAQADRRLFIALGICGVLAIGASLLWLVGGAPGFLNAGSAARIGSHRHAYRGIAAAIGGAGAFAGAWLLRRESARQPADVPILPTEADVAA